MLVPLTDPNHALAALMIDQIARDKRREGAAAIPEASDPTPRRTTWSRLATATRGPNGKRRIRVFRAPAPAI